MSHYSKHSSCSISFYSSQRSVDLVFRAGVVGLSVYDSRSLQSQWSAFYAPGAEIQQYIHRVAEKYKLFQYIKLSHELSRAQWDETTRKWNLRIKNLLTGEDVEDTADIVLNCMGGLERWSWPKIDGLDSFNGRLEHSAAWPKELEVGRGGTGEDYFKGKRGAVIGNVRRRQHPCWLSVLANVLSFLGI